MCTAVIRFTIHVPGLICKLLTHAMTMVIWFKRLTDDLMVEKNYFC